MYLKRILLLVSIMFIINSLKAQQLEFMQPVGYQNPFLKSGQYITSLYYYSRITETERSDNLTKTGEYNINLIGYLGLIDNLTLKTLITVHPYQKIYWYSEGGSGNDKSKFYVDPEFTISYRPIEFLEIFGSCNFSQYEIDRGPYSYYISTLVGYDPETGAAIYEPRLVTTQDKSVYDYTNYRFRFGLTYSGRLW